MYVQPTISKLVPDFILIGENRGISILEVKDWSLSYIKDITMQKSTVGISLEICEVVLIF
ncbi:MAG: hypothetical protein ACLSWP_13050 [Terrisporobacter sp.]|uniref:hypothetical protein n=1 Tax=Terrisporobacter sp. TaxID=1965305 RepID=UPI003994B040